jgi:hypothetical protein
MTGVFWVLFAIFILWVPFWLADKAQDDED